MLPCAVPLVDLHHAAKMPCWAPMTQPRTYKIAGPVGELAVHDWAVPARRHCSPTPPASTVGCGRRSRPASSPPGAACGRSTSAATATAPHRIRTATRTPGPASRPTPSRSPITSASSATRRCSRAGTRRAPPRSLLGEVARPATYLRVWAFEPIMFPTETLHLTADDFPLAGNARKRRNEWPSIDEAYDAYAAKRPLNVMTAGVPARVRGVRPARRGDGVFELKCAPDVEAAVYSMAPRNGAWEQLPRIESSVLVACGEASRTSRRPSRPASPTGSRTARSRSGPASATSARSRTPSGVRRRSSRRASDAVYAACRLLITAAHFSGSDLYGA